MNGTAPMETRAALVFVGPFSESFVPLDPTDSNRVAVEFCSKLK